MKYYHVAAETEINNMYRQGIQANKEGEIPVIVLEESFLLKKFIFDVYAHEVLKKDVYCAFEIENEGIEEPVGESGINSIFADSFKVCRQQHIEQKFIKPFKTEDSYQGMGLVEGVFPVENKDKFTAKYKRKVLEYLQAMI